MLYKNVSGTWKSILNLFTNVSGAWRQVGTLYKRVAGVWKPIHKETYVYTFTANASNVNFATLVGSTIYNRYTNFRVIVNSGVTVSGTNGTTGATGACSTNGGIGGAGNYALNFSGMSGKTIAVVNNGTIRGGNGGTGGQGGAACACGYVGCTENCRCEDVTQNAGYGGAGGAGQTGIYNGTNTVTVTGNAAISGTTGATGGRNAPLAVVCTYCEDAGGCCFIKGQRVTMADGSTKPIEEVRCGDTVLGAYDDINTVMYLHRPILADRDLYLIDGILYNTPTHPMVNGERNGFCFVDVEGAKDDAEIYYVYNNDGSQTPWRYNSIRFEDNNTKQLDIGDEVLTVEGKRRVQSIETVPWATYDLPLYSLVLDGSHTMAVDGYFVGGFIDDTDFDYKTGERK